MSRQVSLPECLPAWSGFLQGDPADFRGSAQAGYNDPAGSVWEDGSATEQGRQLDTSLRDQLRQRLKDFRARGGSGDEETWPPTQVCGVIGSELVCQTQYGPDPSQCRTDYMQPGEAGLVRTEEGCDQTLFAASDPTADVPDVGAESEAEEAAVAAAEAADPDGAARTDCEARGGRWEPPGAMTGWVPPDTPVRGTCSPKISISADEVTPIVNDLQAGKIEFIWNKPPAP